MLPEQTDVKRWLVKARHDWSTVEKILTPECEELDAAVKIRCL